MSHNELVIISNYKCSFKLSNSGPDLLNNLVEKFTKESKIINNFLVLKIKGWVFIIFSNGFVNVTKIRNFREERERLVLFIREQLEQDLTDIIVDNITATTSLTRVRFSHLLKTLFSSKLFKFYPERYSKKKLGIQHDFTTFPAIKIFTDVGTGLLFASGKLNIIGCKNINHISWIVDLTVKLIGNETL